MKDVRQVASRREFLAARLGLAVEMAAKSGEPRAQGADVLVDRRAPVGSHRRAVVTIGRVTLK